MENQRWHKGAGGGGSSVDRHVNAQVRAGHVRQCWLCDGAAVSLGKWQEHLRSDRHQKARQKAHGSEETPKEQTHEDRDEAHETGFMKRLD